MDKGIHYWRRGRNCEFSFNCSRCFPGNSGAGMPSSGNLLLGVLVASGRWLFKGNGAVSRRIYTNFFGNESQCGEDS